MGGVPAPTPLELVPVKSCRGLQQGATIMAPGTFPTELALIDPFIPGHFGRVGSSSRVTETERSEMDLPFLYFSAFSHQHSAFQGCIPLVKLSGLGREPANVIDIRS